MLDLGKAEVLELEQTLRGVDIEKIKEEFVTNA